MRHKIITDLYGTKEKRLKERKVALARQNRDLWLEKYAPIIAQLPPEMITRHKDYQVDIDYTSPNSEYKKLEETWTYSADDPIINPVDANNTSSYLYPVQSPVHDRLETVVNQLCEDILALKKERDAMEDYLRETTEKNKGSLLLKKVWPEVFHKYLPPEPPRTPKKAKPKVVNPDVPDFLKVRLTTNLLEDN
tara:strand:- start:199 stop:777 length:579 start_codon:yes stop_codon:yes gene_type:complete